MKMLVRHSEADGGLEGGGGRRRVLRLRSWVPPLGKSRVEKEASGQEALLGKAQFLPCHPLGDQ